MLSLSLCRSSVANEKHLDEEDIGGHWRCKGKGGHWRTPQDGKWRPVGQRTNSPSRDAREDFGVRGLNFGGQLDAEDNGEA